MEETVSVRIPSEVLSQLEGLQNLTRQSRSDLLRDVLHEGIERKRLELAIEAYRSKKASLGRASADAGVPISLFLDELGRRGILLHYDLEDLRADLEWARAP